MQGARREHPRFGAVTDEQRRSRPGPAPPRKAGDRDELYRKAHELRPKHSAILFTGRTPKDMAIDGLLGLDFLRNRILTMDFKRGRISLRRFRDGA